MNPEAMTSALCLPTTALAAANTVPVARALQDDDREAIAATQRGEREAFDQLVLRYQRDVYRVCFRYVNNHQDANDMAQEVFLKAYRAIGRFRGDSAFSTWLYRIAVNTCLNYRAARKPMGDELTDALPDRRTSALDRLERKERAETIRAAVARLPEKQRATLILRMYQDLSQEEIAQVLGKSVGTVKANLFHAIKNLRKLLGQGGE